METKHSVSHLLVGRILPLPTLPDLNPMDFHKVCIPESKACTNFHPSLGTFEVNLQKCWAEIIKGVIGTICYQVVPRLRQVVYAKGGYLKN